RLGITTVYVTHDQEEALAMSDEVAVMAGGRLEQVGQPYELYHHPGTPFVADFIGLNNFIPGTVRAVTGGTVAVGLRGGERLEVPAARVSGEGAAAGDNASIVVRPEAVTMQAGSPTDTDRAVPGSLIGSQFLRPLRRHWVAVPGADVVVDEPDPPT